MSERLTIGQPVFVVSDTSGHGVKIGSIANVAHIHADHYKIDLGYSPREGNKDGFARDADLVAVFDDDPLSKLTAALIKHTHRSRETPITKIDNFFKLNKADQKRCLDVVFGLASECSEFAVHEDYDARFALEDNFARETTAQCEHVKPPEGIENPFLVINGGRFEISRRCRPAQLIEKGKVSASFAHDFCIYAGVSSPGSYWEPPDYDVAEVDSKRSIWDCVLRIQRAIFDERLEALGENAAYRRDDTLKALYPDDFKDGMPF